MAFRKRDRETNETRTEIFERAENPTYIDRYPQPAIQVKSNVVLGEDDPLVLIPVWPQYQSMLLAINSTVYCIEEHLAPRGRTHAPDFELIKEIVNEIIERHVITANE